MSEPLRARKRADLLSLSGAAIIGAATGAWFAAAVRPFALLVLAVGLIIHAVGMTARHRLDRKAGPLPGTWQWIYTLCWIAIGALLAITAWRWLEGAR